MPDLNTTSMGFTCPKCGAFVPNGNFHSCFGATYPYPILPDWNKVIDLLERILKALEEK